MIGKIHMVWLGLVGLSSGVLFHTSYEVQALEEKLGSLNREIIREQEAIQILRAEWSHLNEPGRIESLAKKYTLLAPTGAVQVALSPEAVPARPAAPMGPALVSAPLPRMKPGSATQAVAALATPPAQVAPVQVAPVQAASIQATPVRAVAPSPAPSAPIQATPIKATPVNATPVNATPVNATPVNATPIQAARDQVADLPVLPDVDVEEAYSVPSAALSIPGSMFTQVLGAED